MAAITLATSYPLRENVGSLNLLIVKSSSVADGDTYASGISGQIVGFWANGEANETAGEEGINVSESSGTFTFGLKTTGAVTLYVLFRG